jgi:O-antigen ligase
LKPVLVGLLVAAILLIECMAGGTRLVYSLPCYALLSLAAIATAFRRPQPDARPRPSCLLISALFFTYILVRASVSPVTYLWWQDFYMVLACLIVYLLTIFYVTGTRDRAIIIWALLALAVLEVIFGLRQFTQGDNWMPFGFVRADSGRRASGSLISSIHLAGYLEVVAVFGLSYAVWGTSKVWARILAGYLAILCYFGVAITGSRGGYLSSLGSLLVFVGISLHVVRATRPEKFWRIALPIGALALGAMAAAVLLMSQSELLRQRLGTIPQQLERGKKDVRIYNWQAALDHFRVNPWLGTGAGTHIRYGRLFRRPEIQSDPIHAHSDYLEMLAEYGIWSGFGMAAFLLAHVRSGWRNYRFVLREPGSFSDWRHTRHDSLALSIGALSAISAYLIHSISDFNLHVPGHALIFAFVFGTVASPAYDLKPTRLVRAATWFRWALPPLGLWVFFFALMKFGGEYWAEKARGAFREGKFSESIRLAEEALTYHEENYELYFYLGAANRGMALRTHEPAARVPYLEAAARAYTKNLALFPHDEHALTRFAQTLGDLGRFREAEAIYRAVIEIDPNLARAHAYYARHLALVGRDAEAEERLAGAQKIAPYENFDLIVRGTSLDPRVKNK